MKGLCLPFLVKQAALVHKVALLMLSITDLMKESMASVAFCFGNEDKRWYWINFEMPHRDFSLAHTV